MDSRELTTLPRPMVYCGLVASLTSLSIGYVIGSPNIPEADIRGHGQGSTAPTTMGLSQCRSVDGKGFPACFEFSDILWGFAVGSFCLGACAGGLVGGSIQNRFGRIRAMLLSNVLFLAGSLVLGLTFHQAQFILGRVIVGLGCGLGGVVAPTYLGEIATIHGRGTISILHQLFLVMGVVLSNIVGLAWSSPPGWRLVLAANAVPALVQSLILPTLVESPPYLVSKKRIQDARVSLQMLRGPKADVEKELADFIALLLGTGSDQDALPAESGHPSTTEILPVQRADSSTTVQTESTFVAQAPSSDPLKQQPSLETTSPLTPGKNQEPYGIRDLFRSECRSLAWIGIMVHFLQQASGVNGLVYYSTSFLGSVFGPSNSRYLTLGLSACTLLATIASVLLIDRVPRRTLLLLSMGGTSLSSMLLLVGAYTHTGILVVAAVFLFMVSFALGMGPIPWLLLSELLPTYALSSASAVATCVNWGTNFVIGLVFPLLARALGNGTFFVFGAINVLGGIYILKMVPETRGRTVEAVMAERGVGPRKK